MVADQRQVCIPWPRPGQLTQLETEETGSPEPSGTSERPETRRKRPARGSRGKHRRPKATTERTRVQVKNKNKSSQYAFQYRRSPSAEWAGRNEKNDAGGTSCMCEGVAWMESKEGFADDTSSRTGTEPISNDLTAA